MNPFDPANLSPIPKSPIPCLLPYDLTWEHIRGILPGFDERQNTSAQAFSSYEKQGLNGGSNSCILTLHYLTVENQFRSETVFIKYTTETEKLEAQRYQVLASLGIPAPRLLAAIHKGNAEIILLEFLAKIGIDFHSASEINSLLYPVAQLNSMQSPSNLFNPSPGIPQSEFNERVRNALLKISRDQSLPFTVNPLSGFDVYQIARAACQSMPLAVNHNEFSFQQVGWAQRDGMSQLVIFDLETMSLRPRFTDIAGILPSLAKYTGWNQLGLFKIYLDRMCKLNPIELGIDEAFHELRFVRIKDTFDSLPWLVDVAKEVNLNKMLDGPLSKAVQNLYDDLMELGFLF